jgi:hypothetical protein
MFTLLLSKRWAMLGEAINELQNTEVIENAMQGYFMIR